MLAAAEDDRVVGLCLIDPVDNNRWGPQGPGYPSAAARLGAARPIPAAVIGAGMAADCVPSSANFRYAAVSSFSAQPVDSRAVVPKGIKLLKVHSLGWVKGHLNLGGPLSCRSEASEEDCLPRTLSDMCKDGPLHTGGGRLAARSMAKETQAFFPSIYDRSFFVGARQSLRDTEEVSCSSKHD